MSAYLENLGSDDIICAPATPAGMGAVALIRVSGKDSLEFLDRIFRPAKQSLKISESPGYSIQHGYITEGEEMIDEVLISVFRAPHSYTGENVAEVGCHGSVYIQQRILGAMTGLGARMARPGEFTLRAFMNGKYDLAQSEAIADLIASTSKASHDLALQQMRGGYSKKIKDLRQQLVEFAALLELELDFSEEDVEFADRTRFTSLVAAIEHEIIKLLDSFRLGNVLKQGIPVTIIGKPNVGKSTLLNAILNEEKAIVSEIPGTTRDYIEDVMVIEGVAFRFIDTAGLHHTTDEIESLGIEKTYEKINQAMVILYVFDINEMSIEEVTGIIDDLKEHMDDGNKQFILVANKTDLLVESPHHFMTYVEEGTVFVSAKRKENISLIIEQLLQSVRKGDLYDNTIVSNSRHYEALEKALVALGAVRNGFTTRLSTDLIALDLRQALYYMGLITGEVTTDEVLGNIFSRFCIGK